MIDRAVLEEKNRFEAIWQGTLGRSPFCTLDGGYASLRILDLLLSPFRGLKENNVVFDRVVRGVSATLSVYIHDTFQKLGRQTEVKMDQDGIFLDAPKGFGFNQDMVERATVEQFLVNLLRDPPPQMWVFRNFSRDLHLQGNWLTPLSVGVLLGSSPIIQDCDFEITDEYLEKVAQPLHAELARQSVDTYARLFPDEQLGQVAELYLSRLIIPPMYYREELPVIEAVRGLHEFMTNFSISIPKMRELTENLARYPDEQIAAAGLAFRIALHEGPLNSQIYGWCRRFGAFLGLMREAMIEARRLLYGEDDWIHSDKPLTLQQQGAVTNELLLGFIPWLEFPLRRIFEIVENEQLGFVVRALADFDIARAKAACDKLVEDTPGDVDYRLQRVHLDYIEGDFERALAGCRSLLTEPEAETNAAVYNLLGSLQMVTRQVDPAITSFERARAFCTNNATLAGKVGNNYAWALMCREKFSDALDVIDLMLSTVTDNLILRMNRVSVLASLGRFEDCLNEQQGVIELSPFYQQTFLAMCHATYTDLNGGVH